MSRLHNSISLLFVGLISLSLSLSTVHSHSAIQASTHEINHPGIVHSIEQDATFCPVCGYLQKAEVPSPPIFHSPEGVEEILPETDESQIRGPIFYLPTGRSPPHSSQ